MNSSRLRSELISEAKKRLLISVLFGAGILIVLLPLLGSLVVLSLAMITSTFASYNDIHKESVVVMIIDRAQQYYHEYNLYPSTVDELIAHEAFPSDVSQELQNTQAKTRYIYNATLDGQNCAVITVLSDSSIFEKKCKE